jgi:hypothetical protein
MSQVYGPSLDLEAQHVRHRRRALADQPDVRPSLGERIVNTIPEAMG